MVNKTGRKTVQDGGTTRLDQRVDDLTGRVMAWVGGTAVVLGIVFLLAIGVSNGWIGEGMRTVLAGLGSAGLLAVGAWLRERKAQTDAAFAAAAAGIAGLFVTVVVAAQVYELVPSLVGTGLALGIGGIATALALRWRSQGLAALGILGGIASPLLGGAELDGGTIAILFVALAAATGVLLWQRWDWLALAALALGLPQWAAYVTTNASPTSATITLIAFGALGVAIAVGYDVRVGAEKIRPVPAFLLGLNAIALALTGWLAFDGMGDPAAGKLWLAGLAVAHIAVGAAGPRVARLSRDLGLLSLVIGVVLADIAFGLTADGFVLTLGWAATSVGFAALLRRTPAGGRDEALVSGGLGGHLALAIVVAFAADDPVGALAGGGDAGTVGVTSIAALAAACLVSARLTDGRRFDDVLDWRIVLDGLGLAAVALLTALTLDGSTLALAWIGEVVVLTAIAHRLDDRVAGWGALGFLCLAVIHALAFEAPPISLVTGLADPIAALATVGGLGLAALFVARKLPDLGVPEIRPLLTGLGALTLLYLGSCLVVTPFESGNAVESALLSAHQQGQMVLSVFWALVAVTALVVGLRRDLAVVRYAALALLAVAVAKVFLIDLATLTSVYRVVSFIALGLLLLVAAFVWQRLRPQVLPDLRDTPPAVR
jgi:uncharacterized membrane protein